MQAHETDKDDWGLAVKSISEDEFRHFAKRYGDSPEIGPIATCLDHRAPPKFNARHYVVGLAGCGKLCAVACFELYESKTDGLTQVVKLDSVIVDPDVRRRGLAGLLVTQTFLDLVKDESLNVVRIYAHSVHPATVLLLRRLAFSDPPLTGAPISHLCIAGDERTTFIKACEKEIRDQLGQKLLQCEFCRTGSRRARPWCKPRG